MRIAFIGQKAIPFYRDGGVERHVEELSTHLASKGHEVTVFVRPRYLATKEDLWEGLRLVRVLSIPTKHLDTISATFFSTLAALRGQYNIIHYHGVGPALLSFLPRLFTRAKIVVTFHSIDRFHAKWGVMSRVMLRMGERAAMHVPHATIAVSHSITAYCKRHYGKTPVYIPNGVTLHQEKIGAESLLRFGLKKNAYLMVVARLVRHKGIHTLIEAFNRIHESVRGEMKLLIVGAPSFTSDYETYLKELAANDHRIVFAGYQTGETLAELYSHAYLYVHPSESEGLSLSILEAMGYGKCVVLSDIPENLESMDHSGIPFKVGDPDNLAQQLVSLINHPELVEERGKRGILFIKKSFTWDKIAKDTESLYQSLLPKIKDPRGKPRGIE